MQYETKTTTKIGEPKNNFKIFETVIYKGEERKIVCFDYIEDLLGLEPINEPELVIWVRRENCKKITPKIVEDYVEQELIKHIDGVKDEEGEWVIKPIYEISFSDYMDGDETTLTSLFTRDDKLNYLKSIYTKLI